MASVERQGGDFKKGNYLQLKNSWPSQQDGEGGGVAQREGAQGAERWPSLSAQPGSCWMKT